MLKFEEICDWEEDVVKNDEGEFLMICKIFSVYIKFGGN